MTMLKSDYSLQDFNFYLPDELIAQYPIENRDESKLFVINRITKQFNHTVFNQITDYFNEGDVLVFNNAKVIKARIYCNRESGGKLEIILTKKLSDTTWQGLTNRKKRLKVGETVRSIRDTSVTFTIKEKEDDFVSIQSNIPLTDDILDKIGIMPLPPYIKRDSSQFDAVRYQTVYAEKSGAVAAPTAGLHFTDELLQQLQNKGVSIIFCTLNVSWGTFQPVRNQNLADHSMHTETYELSEESAKRINEARDNNKKIFAVGTTSLRVLESTYKNGYNSFGFGDTDLFIYPPYEIKSIDGLITNFHTPESTLLMLVSAFAGYDTIMEAYNIAVKEKYRFFSYGDSMIIL